MTTVEELIDYLTQFPPGTPVVFKLASEVCDLDLADIRFVTAESRALIRHHNLPGWYLYRPDELPPNPQYVTALIFPGSN